VFCFAKPRINADWRAFGAAADLRGIVNASSITEGMDYIFTRQKFWRG
jgi:hypothetical protein